MVIALLFALAAAAGGARAGEASVVDVNVIEVSAGVYRFDVSVRHADSGWDHYADRWEIVGPDGTVYGARTLLHPHVGEQPFTRSLGGVVVPEGATRMTVRAHDSVHGLGGATLTVEVVE